MSSIKYLGAALLFGALCLVTSHARASGSGIRGGGKGLVCRNADGSVRSVELLDLWESRVIYGRTIAVSSAPVREQVSAAIARMAASNVATFDDAEMNEIVRDANLQMLNDGAEVFLNETPPAGWRIEVHRLSGTTLAITDDSFEIAWAANCSIEQIVIWKHWANGSAVYINQDLFNRLDATNQAALILHESIYSLSTSHMTVPSSVRTRRAVGYVFSGAAFDAWPDGRREHVNCVDRATKLKVALTLYRDDAGALRSHVFRGYDEKPTGFFPSHPRFIEGQRDALKDILTAKTQKCDQRASREPFVIALLGGGGPADFDRNGGLAGVCLRGKLQVFWIDGGFTRLKLNAMTRLSCGHVASK